MMTSSTPTIEISKKDDKWTVKTSTMMSNSSTMFALGDQYEETMMGGRTIKVSFFFNFFTSKFFALKHFIFK